MFWGVIVVVKQYAHICEVSALWSGWYLIEVVLGTCFGLHTYFNLKLRCASAPVDFAIIECFDKLGLKHERATRLREEFNQHLPTMCVGVQVGTATIRIKLTLDQAMCDQSP